MAIRDVVRRGYGVNINGIPQDGSIALVVLRGYTSGAITADGAAWLILAHALGSRGVR